MSGRLQSPALRFGLSQVGWFACILGAAHGHLWLGPVTVAGLSALFVWSTPPHGRSLARLVAVALVGVLTDSLLVAADALVFPDAVQLAPALPGPPLWMVALWVGFGTTLGGVLRALRTRLLLAALVGASSACSATEPASPSERLRWARRTRPASPGSVLPGRWPSRRCCASTPPSRGARPRSVNGTTSAREIPAWLRWTGISRGSCPARPPGEAPRRRGAPSPPS